MDEGISELNNILSAINESRLQIYKKVTYNYLGSLKEDISSTFWLKNRIYFSDKIDDMDKEILQTNRNVIQKDLNSETIISNYQNKINNLLNLRSKLDSERKELKVNQFFKTVLWGVPIILGVYLSGKYPFEILIYVFILVLLTAITLYFISSSASFQKVIIKNKMPLSILFLFSFKLFKDGH